jgi:3-hexulose-6-phosphate synthase
LPNFTAVLKPPALPVVMCIGFVFKASKLLGKCHLQSRRLFTIMTPKKGRVCNMQLQLALDQLDLPEALKIIEGLQDLIDIAEIGTPMIIAEGLSAVEGVKRRFPHLTVLADVKIVDGGAYESKIAFQAGADIVSVLGLAHDVTLKAAIGVASGFKRSIMVDLLGVQSLVERIAQVERLGADYVCVHTAADLKGLDHSTLSHLEEAVGAANAVGVTNRIKIAVAGGISSGTIDRVVAAGPDVVVVGGGIVDQPDRRAAAEYLKTRMQRAGRG